MTYSVGARVKAAGGIAVRMLALLMLFAAGMLAAPGCLQAAPVTVKDFDCLVRVLGSGDIEVTENLLVDIPAEGEFHGIYRDIPVATRWRERGRSTMEVLSVTLDGEPRPADDTGRDGTTVRVYQRNRDRLLPPGVHRFVLTYRMTGQVGMFEANDELTWNVTGSGWENPVGKASCTVVCPEGAPEYGASAWLGEKGSRNSEGISMHTEKRGGSVVMVFRAGRAVRPGEEFTVAAGWGKGFITLPPAEGAGLATYLLAGLLAAVFAYSMAVWMLFGRDPARGVVVPLFHAPEYVPSRRRGKSGDALRPARLSPAAVCFLHSKARVTGRCFGSALLSLAAKGVCSIKGSSKEGYVLSLPQGASSGSPVSAEEAAVTSRLESAGGTLRVGRARRGQAARDIRPKGGKTCEEVLYEMRSAMRRSLEDEFRGLWRGGHDGSLLGALFGSKWTLLGALLALAGLSGVLALEGLLDTDFFEVAAGLLLIVYFFAMFGRNIASGLGRRWKAGRHASCLILAVPFALMFLLVGGGFLSIFWAVMEDYLDDLQICLSGAVVAVPCMFSFIMDAPTPEARKMLDGIEGLAMYIGTAESARMNALNPPDRSMEHYRELLPYAVALGLERAWGAYFADVLAAESAVLRENGWLEAGACGGFSDAADVSASSGGGEGSSGSSFGGGGGGAGGGGGGGGGGGC